MKLNYKRTVCIGLAFMGISAFWQVYDTVIPLILKNTYSLGDTVTGAVMAADNLLAVLLLPLLGAWSDRVDTRLGKRTPFILAGTLSAVLFMMLIPYADQNASLLFFLTALFAVLLSMGLYRSPAVALMPDLTPPDLRSQGNAVINVMGALGALYALVMIRLLVKSGEHPNYTPLFAAMAFLMLLALVLLLCTVREKKLAARVAEEYPELKTAAQEDDSLSPEVKKSLTFALAVVICYYMSYNGITTAFSRYAQAVWGLDGGTFAPALIVIAITAFVSYIPLGALSARIGRRKVIFFGFAMMALSFIVITFYGTLHPILYFWMIFVGVGGSAAGVNIFPLAVSMCPNSALGRYTGLYYTFSMGAQIVTPILSGFFMEYVSYRTLFPYTAFFALLGMVAVVFVKHGDVKQK